MKSNVVIPLLAVGAGVAAMFAFAGRANASQPDGKKPDGGPDDDPDGNGEGAGDTGDDPVDWEAITDEMYGETDESGAEDGQDGAEDGEASPPLPPEPKSPTLTLLAPIFNDAKIYNLAKGEVPLVKFRYDANGQLLGWDVKRANLPTGPTENEKAFVTVELWAGGKKVKTLIPNTSFYTWNVASNWKTSADFALPKAAADIFGPTADVFFSPKNAGTWRLSELIAGAQYVQP